MTNELGTFTPISNALAQEVGLVCAAVYGLVWRKCQLPEGVCRASLKTLGSEIGVDRATVLRNVTKLCELGYLIDQTPERRNAPHTYVLGKSVAQNNTSEGNTVVIRNSSEGESVAYNNSSIQTVAESNATVAESNTREVFKESNTPTSNEVGGDAPIPIGHAVKKPETIPKVEYTEFEYGFLTYFSARRFKNPTQHKTIAGLIALHGETEVDNLAQWAAKKGMGLGQAIPAIESALKNPHRQNGATNGHQTQNQARQAQGGHYPPAGGNQNEQAGRFGQTAAELGAALASKSRASREPT